MRTNHHNTRPSARRLSGYVYVTDKNWWHEQLASIRKLEGLTNASMGTLFARISKFNLRLDLPSIAEYVKTHKPAKRKRDQDPARA